MSSKRSIKELTFSGSGEQVVYLPEGASGKFSVWALRTEGSASSTVTVSGCFSSSPESGEKYSVGSGSATGTLAVIAENKLAQFGHLAVSVSSGTGTTVKVYIVSF